MKKIKVLVTMFEAPIEVFEHELAQLKSSGIFKEIVPEKQDSGDKKAPSSESKEANKAS
jgi:hypothetical protein